MTSYFENTANFYLYSCHRLRNKHTANGWAEHWSESHRDSLVFAAPYQQHDIKANSSPAKAKWHSLRLSHK